MNNIKDLEDSLIAMIEETGIGYSRLFELSGRYFIRGLQNWLRKEHRIIVLPSAIIDPKYNDRVLWSINLIEWSRTHSFYMNKSQNIYYDSYEEALLKGLLQGLEIVKTKVDGTTAS